MKVKELIEMLYEYDKDLEVLLSSDAEGNSYSKLNESCIGSDCYYTVTSYGIDICSPEDKTEEDKPCIVIYP